MAYASTNQTVFFFQSHSKTALTDYQQCHDLISAGEEHHILKNYWLL